MNIQHLALFIRVAATHNISQAGQDMGISPAVASSYLNKLEAELGVRLLHRTTRQVALTEDGDAFLPHAESVMDTIELAKASVGSAQVAPKGNLRITAPASFGRMHLIPAMAEFTQRYPDITLDIRLSDSIVDMVEGGFDVAIRDAALNDSTLVAKKLAPDKRLLCASPDYLKLHGTPQSPDDLSSHQCLSLVGLETWTFTSSKGLHTVKTKNKLKTDNGEAVRDACTAGMGITICSTWCAYKELSQGTLVPVITDYPLQSKTSIWAVYPSSRQLAPKVRVFIDYLRDCFGDTPYWDEYIA